MADRYDAKMCEERHNTINRRFGEGQEHFKELHAKLDKFMWVIISAQGVVLLAILSAFLAAWIRVGNSDAKIEAVRMEKVRSDFVIARHAQDASDRAHEDSQHE